ncbi:ferredoxin family protein [Desulfovibrio sulfodismutans]|uniref:Ferredoxin family protein n=1 Tax=Desulfolutivibrio sulfodismutans TaxID=63561 RepID=A0A7K3NJC5_9BACT|nr:ferredoxin family protein [Desulfolutivibrio sulfodismutans]NDY55875.1 ferredoxin family protein [Desulfolutivibrio sulfodismutans]QLA11143.1 4Fe-4S dicluster domain-containing protein [Desulfolutivibrio sulfodismutans DSM 3696]
MTAKRKPLYTVVIYPDWCKGCGICAAFCPKKVLRIDHQGKARVDREDECINCGFCELHCPDFAIVVRPRNGMGSSFPEPIPGTAATPCAPPGAAASPPSEAAQSPEPKKA